jgi:DNA-binding transcriptional LysR family regulator
VDFEELKLLIALAEHGSFLETAHALKTSRARLRRKLASLEERAGTRLLARDQGSFVPTEAGAHLIEGARRLIEEGALLVAHAREIGQEPTGVLRIAIPVGYPRHLVALAGRVLGERFPQLRTVLRVAEDPVALLPTEADLAICFHDFHELPGLAQFPILQARVRLLASSEYLEEHGAPSSPADLQHRPLLTWRPPGGAPDVLVIDDEERLSVRARMRSTDDQFLRHAARAGDGIAYVPDPSITDPEFADLVPVLPDRVGRTTTLRLFVPHALRDVPRVRAVVDAARTIAT